MTLEAENTALFGQGFKRLGVTVAREQRLIGTRQILLHGWILLANGKWPAGLLEVSFPQSTPAHLGSFLVIESRAS